MHLCAISTIRFAHTLDLVITVSVTLPNPLRVCFVLRFEGLAGDGMIQVEGGGNPQASRRPSIEYRLEVSKRRSYSQSAITFDFAAFSLKDDLSFAAHVRISLNATLGKFVANAYNQAYQNAGDDRCERGAKASVQHRVVIFHIFFVSRGALWRESREEHHREC